MKASPSHKSALPQLALLASLALTIGAFGQSPISINNAGFENPVIDDGAFSSGVPGWTAFNGGQIGVLNPAFADLSGGAPEGQNVASVTSSNNENGLSQTLASTFQENAVLTLTVAVGNTKIDPSFPGYRVQLLAAGTILAQDDADTVPLDSFVTSTVTYSFDEADAALVGQPLEIRLLSKGQVASSEVAFDDVRLSVSFADPVANAGGPYVVSPGSALSLNGSASAASDGEEVTAYEWDLNNDGNFGDVSGVSPDSITYLDLQNVWGMSDGTNTIQLRITDSSAKQSIATTTVTLVTAEPTPGFGIYFNAAQADDVSEYWNDLVAGNPTGLGLLLDKAETGPVNRVPVTGSNTLLTHAFDFPGNLVANSGGARLVDTQTTTFRSFATPGWNTQNISMEMWFKPATIDPVATNPAATNGEILFEDGGGTGMGFFVGNNQIRFVKIAGSPAGLTYNLSTDPDGVLEVPAISEFIQVVGTFHAGNGAMQLFVNGTLVRTGSSNAGSWSGGDHAAFGTRGQNNVGGLGGGQQGTVSFSGQMALIRAYSQKILNAAEVRDNYRAFAPDETPPAVASFNPADDASGVYPGISSLFAVFNEDVMLTGEGTVTIRNLDDTSEQVINLPNSSVVLDGARTLVIGLASNLAFGTNFAIRISADAVTDLSGNLFPGIDDDTTWSFATAEQNLNPPVIITRSPADDAGGVPIGSSFVATFDQDILLGSGDIVIKDLFDDSTTKTIAVTDASQVSIAGNVLTINPTTVLLKSTDYAVQIPSSAVRNFSDIAFAGITNETDWNFKTANLAGQLGILDLASNGGINPATDEPWKAADRYRLVFISSDPVNPRDGAAPSSFGSWNSISTWNAEAQNFANNAVGQDLSGITWKVLGSTPTVNARDNTATNPAVNGSGHPIMLIDGKTVVADDFNRLWGGAGSPVRNTIRYTQNLTGTGENQHINDVPTIWWPFTGTNASGVNLGAGGSMRDIDAGGSIRQGQGDNLLGWIDRANFTVAAQSTGTMAIYAMSDPLFVIDLDDDVAPTLVSFADNVGGGSVFLGDEPIITYTVTFDEAMLPSTVNTIDFGNAGSSAITVNSVVQQEDPAVFLVGVTPLSPGTLQLQINQGAGLTDLNGNPLDTSAALLDDTIITVSGEAAAGYNVWVAGFEGFTDSSPGLDFDGGGLANALEWMLGGDPTDGGDDASIAPTIDNSSDPDFFIFTHRRTQASNTDPNTTIAVEYGSDLLGWTTAVAGENVLISVSENGAGDGIDLVEVKIRRTLAEDGKLFARLMVDVEQP